MLKLKLTQTEAEIVGGWVKRRKRKRARGCDRARGLCIQKRAPRSGRWWEKHIESERITLCPTRIRPNPIGRIEFPQESCIFVVFARDTMFWNCPALWNVWKITFADAWAWWSKMTYQDWNLDQLNFEQIVREKILKSKVVRSCVRQIKVEPHLS